MKSLFQIVILYIGSLLITSKIIAQNAQQKPNVLIVLVDEWRAQSTGYAGDKNVQTPNLDKLAATSANFHNAVSSMPVCTPFRASLITGQRPLTHGLFMNDVLLDTNAVTIAKLYKQNGYETGYIGKWHLDGNKRLNYTPPGARRQGFSYWKAVNCDHDYNHSVYYDNNDTTRRYWDGYDVFAQTKDAQTFIENTTKTAKPFFLVLSLGAPHDPFHTAPEKYRAMYPPEKMILSPNVPDSMKKKVQKDIAGYYAHMTAIDDKLGELMNTLRTTGILNNTLIVFTSDHGNLVGAHGMYFKQQPYDESIRVPMLFYYSGKQKIIPKKYDAMFNTEDIMPTILGLTNMSIPAKVEGINFNSYLTKNTKNPKDTVALISCVQPFGQWSRKKGGKEYRGIRTPRYTYAKDLKGAWVLFDNVTDPYQLKNLVNDKNYAALQERLDNLLMKELQRTNDKFLSGLEYVKQYNYPTLDATETVGYTQ